MAALSDHAEDLLLKWLLTDASVTRPTAWYLALYSAAPNDAGGGTELSGSGYSRQAVDFGTDGKSNVEDVVFEASGGDWAEATHVGIFDAPTSGNLILYGAMTAPKQLDDGDTLTFAAGAIDVSLD
jgi:hypothetical protein